jgi:NAD(P)H-hydrate epimerase
MLRLTRAQVREIDRRAIEEYHIPGIVLMENAARGVAAKVGFHYRRHRHLANPRTLIVCGGGNNGGDGLAVARRLHNRGFKRVQIVLANPIDRYTGDALTNLKIVQAMKIPLWTADPDQLPEAWTSFDLVVDALFGTGLTSTPRDTKWIDLMNQQPAPILAVDLPSGLDCDTGKPLGTCVKAKYTVTFVAEKAGFANPESKQYTGEVHVGDIGCPPELINRVAEEKQ